MRMVMSVVMLHVNCYNRILSLILFLASSCAGKVVNIKHLDEVINSINDWYMERGLFGMVCASSFMILFSCHILANVGLDC